MKRARHVPTKGQLLARLHRGLRPRLSREQLRDLSLAHVVNLDAIARGEATEEILWQVVGGTLTWHRVAQQLQRGEDEMAAQMEVTTRLVERYGRTGRVLFSGADYQVAQLGVDVMDALAAEVDRTTAGEAADWSEARVAELAASVNQPLREAA